MRKAKGLGIVATDAAPQAIGPYSQAVTTDGMIYTAGQIPIDPATGQAGGRTTAEQTQQVMKNLRAILEAAGVTRDNGVKATVYLSDMADFPQTNRPYA